ncbi:patatin-like phospholipase family protein [Vibrio sp. SCSIO 43136]|uniref:patatin-like phospholipase family protein n=1 Tax=Vibrio sp. SCSIO 43136 TaxID=2819101 RepID=UPI002075376F|nr:patatin-like phospholipase family protein [Vibrio sp. SCSIO 43136]USD64813.1 patatin-like phospholipase family protein [Vibrio sp. SCSIO 43136]
MTKRFICHAVCCLLLLPSLVLAQTEIVKPDNLPTDRPVIGVVFAGGGAKGAAHVGVLKALEEMQIPVDIITGTSMGAFVGGLYATGLSADEIEVLFETSDWNSGYRDRVDRSERSVRDKIYSDRYQINADIGFRDFEFTAPKGVVQGQNMLRLIRDMTGNLTPIESFDDLAVRYRAVATDIVELQPVVLHDGYLTDAMMASMSVPGALPPYKIGDKLLVDGGVTNNMPVELARQMGAEMIIAVDISTDYKSEQELKSFLTVGDQLSNYMVKRSTQRQANKLQSQDVLLSPNVGDMETTEFDRLMEAYELGYQAAMEATNSLKKFRVNAAQYQDYIEYKQARRRTLTYGDQEVISRIEFNNDSSYDSELVQQYLNLESGQKLTQKQIEQKIDDLYAVDRFERISYRYRKEADETVLVLDIKGKEWGPNFIDLRFFLEDDFQTQSQYSLGMSTAFTSLNSMGSELALNLEMGTDKLIEAEFFTPVFPLQNIFSSTLVSYSNSARNFPLTPNGLELSSDLEASQNYLPATYLTLLAETSIEYNPSLWQRIRAGVKYVDGSIEFASLPSLGHADYTRFGPSVSYRYDTLDDLSFPSEGTLLNLEYFASQDKIKDSDPIEASSNLVHEVVTKLLTAETFNRHTLVGQLEYEVVNSQDSALPIEPRSLGGFLNLSGIPRNSLIGQNKLFGSVVYRYRWFDNDFGLFNSPLYLGASLEYGGVWSGRDVPLEDAPLHTAGSLFAGVASPIGPIVLAWGQAESKYNSVYLIVGTQF